MQFSLIIPLEFHRGQAEPCVRAWAQAQGIAREAYEILLAIPATFDEAELARLAQLLTPHDRLIRLPYEHDAALVAHAARAAHGDVLVFTEAHCLPEPDFLAQCALVLAEQSEWAGFSCRSIPVTHNLLSEIEAEMYDADIQRNMREHPWLKVLDQCLVIRRDAYEAVGGIEPQFGHFAEWVFAARLYRQGYQMGYDTRPAIHHYYVGELHDLEEFTLDFAAGQMRFAELANADPCGDLFEEVPEWSQRQRWNPQVAGSMTRLLVRDRLQTLFYDPQRDLSFWSSLVHWPWPLVSAWLGLRHLTLRGVIAFLRLQIIWQRIVLRWCLYASDKPQAQSAFLRLIVSWVHLGRLAYLSSLPKQQLADECAKPSSRSEWVAGMRQSLPSAGLHESELRGRKSLRWSEQAATIWLPPLKGNWLITMEWNEAAPFWQRQQTRFYLNECRVPSTCVTHHENLTEFVAIGAGEQALRLSWVCAEFAEPQDIRRLGLPLSRISWIKEAQAATTPAVTMEGCDSSIYFLHVVKCAGTTTRLLLTNTFSAREILFAYNVSCYYAQQLKNQPELHLPYALASGHFGWELISQVTNRPWRVVTIVREPLERLLSQFDYLSQHKRLRSEDGFAAWIEHDLRADDLMLTYFVPSLIGVPTHGIKAFRQTLADHLPTALANLRSCEVVGLQERLDDSLNLMCAATGSLPPRCMSRVNVTLNRTPLAELDAQALGVLTEYLGAEREFYAVAKAIFEQQLARLHQQLAAEEGRELDMQGVRDVLRRKYFARRSDECLRQGPPTEIVWTPDDDFPGHNLYDREAHVGQTLRWSGPDRETLFYFPVAAGTHSTIEIVLHSATPGAHAEGARLFVNGAEVPLNCVLASEGYVLTGVFDPAPPPTECGAFSEFKLVTLTRRGTNEFRELGVALQQIHLQRHTDPDE